MWTYVRLLRPADWIKNVFVFAALAFGDRLGDPGDVWLSVLAFTAFCLTASAGYIFNDMIDVGRDRRHPTKKYRPLASGAVSFTAAGTIATALLIGALALSVTQLPYRFSLTLTFYLILATSYTLVFKRRMILDVLVIAILFVLRALGGAYAIDVPVSPWLLICTFMLCMFVGFGKRRCEIVMLANDDDLLAHRPTLPRYTPDLLTHLLSTSGGIAIITFLLYTLDTTTPSPFGDRKHALIYTLPLVVYGVFRFAMLIGLGKAAGPTQLILKDRPFFVTVLLWGVAVIALLYWDIPLP